MIGAGQGRRVASTALAVVAGYLEALGTRDTAAAQTFYAEDFELDFVHGDAFASRPSSLDEATRFWPAVVRAFPDMELLVVRTFAAAEAVVVEWVFAGSNTGPLEPPFFACAHPATGRTVRLRGVSLFDVDRGRIGRETMYFDYATLLVELGVTP